jgi:hypothetical protein
MRKIKLCCRKSSYAGKGEMEEERKTETDEGARKKEIYRTQEKNIKNNFSLHSIGFFLITFLFFLVVFCD